MRVERARKLRTENIMLKAENERLQTERNNLSRTLIRLDTDITDLCFKADRLPGFATFRGYVDTDDLRAVILSKEDS